MPSGNNVCDCPNPPGGIVICEPDQLAICRIKNGQLRGECTGPPRPLTSSLNRALYFNWALGEITETRRGLHQPIHDSEWLILREGIYSEPLKKVLVQFRFPRILARLFPELRSWPSV